ncbi:hypothetical protein BT96DRAFT_827660 [Gymnopus androsaceus JB14]|uniref:NAD(P)-binding domain-containing protein n=1 Tax=Gymnopus androsaceus JB14 TaxID=1447944 RepID=A0A6A4HBD0_9AGAR|nr:hypothetical protein BT96DRAFT_827660 [Gymnopus androsaceus JB14]
MKVLLTGSTGQIGRGVLEKSLESPDITSIVVLTRRELPEAIRNHPKLSVIILKDFTSYPPEVLKELIDVDACIWSLGVLAANLTFEEKHRITIDYTFAFLEAWLKSKDTIPESQKKPARFLFVAGHFTRRNQELKIWFKAEQRLLGGRAQNQLIEYAEQRSSSLELFIINPAFVYTGFSLLSYLFPSISGELLSNAMLDVAVHGGELQILDNTALKARGVTGTHKKM